MVGANKEKIVKMIKEFEPLSKTHKVDLEVGMEVDGLLLGGVRRVKDENLLRE